MARPSGALSFAYWAIDEFGKVRNDQATVRVSQAELARCYGVSASTVSWYISELHDAVISRRPLVFDLALLGPAAGSRTAAADLAELSESFRNLAADIARLAAGSRDAAAASDRFSEKAAVEDLLTAAGDSVEQPAASRDRLEDLLAPLTAVAARRGLTGMVHPDGVRAALAAYDDEQIAGAVARVVDDIEAGAAIRRPFGVLVARAMDGDRALFRPTDERASAPVVPLTPRLSHPRSELPPPDPDVPTIPANIAAELDREAAREVAERFPAMAEKMLANGPLRRALVASLWKERCLAQDERLPEDRSHVS